MEIREIERNTDLVALDIFWSSSGIVSGVGLKSPREIDDHSWEIAGGKKPSEPGMDLVVVVESEVVALGWVGFVPRMPFRPQVVMYGLGVRRECRDDSAFVAQVVEEILSFVRRLRYGTDDPDA